MAEKINAQRDKRQGFDGGAGKGRQGGNGSGKEICSKDSVSKPGPSFKSGSDMVGQELIDDLKVGGVEIVKGVSAPSFATERKGETGVGKGLGGKAKPPKAAEEAGHD